VCFLVWVLVEKNDCSTAAPNLFNAARRFFIGLSIDMVVKVIGCVLAYRFWGLFFRLFQAQTSLSAHLSAQQTNPHHRNKHT
jgi:hypothetical protein